MRGQTTLQAAEVPVYTLDDLASRLPAPPRGALEAITGDVPAEEFVRIGATIATSRILTDEARLYSQAFDFYTHATESQKEALVGFTPELLALAVHQAVALRAMERKVGVTGQAQASAQAQRSGTFTEQMQAAIVGRDQLRTVLLSVAGRNRGLRGQVAKATGTADDAELLANGIEALVAVGRAFLLLDGPPRARAQIHGLKAIYLDSMAAMAASLRQAADARVTLNRTTQGELDHADGINAHLLGEIIHVFQAAHDREGSIPRLVPIAARRLFSRSGARAAVGNPDDGPSPGDGQPSPA
jgi:hypothetical protein